MERGDDKSAVFVLSIIGIVGVLASVAIFLGQPTGLVTQESSVYPTVASQSVGLLCPSGQAVFLGVTGRYGTYCCLTDMNGQNGCKYPHRILIT